MGEKGRDLDFLFDEFQYRRLQERAGSRRKRSDGNGSQVEEDEKRVRVLWKRMKYLLLVLSITVAIYLQ